MQKKTKSAYSTKPRIVKAKMARVIQSTESNYTENYVKITSKPTKQRDKLMADIFLERKISSLRKHLLRRF